jgi:hypothetical protein
VALTADQLAQLRRMIDEATDANGYTDSLLVAGAEAYFADGVYNLRSYAASLWEEKAAKAAELVRTSESGSSRDMQQVFDHYMALANRFGGSAGTETPSTASYPRSTRIVRPVREG